MDRRHFIGLAVAGSVFANATWAKGASVSATSLGDGISLISGGGGNVVALRGSEGLLLVDGGNATQSADVLRAALAATGTKKLHTLFNTHWHPDQTGLNERAGKEGVRIIAHENTRLWLTSKIHTDWMAGSYGPFKPASLPNKSFYTKESIDFGGETLEFGHLGQAHTDGDLYVMLKKANLLVAGGVVSNEGWPVMDWQTGGWIGGLTGAYDRLIKISDDATRVVPANGPVLTKKDLQDHRAMYFTVFDRLVKLLVKGQGPDEAVAAKPAKEFEAKWGNSDIFVRTSFKSLWGHYAPDA
jgi:glyoxylase-like metal-dependent hydrolase (beta-lactamase superfamily II)